MKHYLLPLFAAALLASGCASSPSTSESKSTATAAQATAAIAAAEKSQAQAAKVGYEWRDTGDLIADAKKAAADKDFDKAVKLATKADHQGSLAVKQQAIEAERMGKAK